ncbi:hypothetical protein J6590_102016 [Homalodisca vitripennis]|nr:hypothetical protein J6590_102016 [Homalodisca vitripennis]
MFRRDEQKRKRKTEDLFAEPISSDLHATPVNVKKRSNNVIVLDDDVVEACAQKCCRKIYDFIGRDAIVSAHYFSLHFDENTTSCKAYEQRKRREACRMVIDAESRRRVFVKTIQLARSRLLSEEKVQLLCADNPPESAVYESVRQKMLLPTDGVSRFPTGEGEWECFYTIRDVERATRERGTRIRWCVFGNDSDIGLGVLLYTSERTKIYYANGSKKVVSFPLERRGLLTSIHTDTYKVLHFLSLGLLGNDYVPRMVNESKVNIVALGREVNHMISTEDDCCRQQVALLSGIFRDDTVTAEDRKPFAKSLAYVFCRLLLAVYDNGRNRNVDVGADSIERDDWTDTPTLRCKNGAILRFGEYFAVFALHVLWYLSYCLFYHNIDSGRKLDFLTRGFVENGFQLIVPGLPIRNWFDYNERRVLDSKRISLSLVDVRRAVLQFPTAALFGVMENEVMDTSRDAIQHHVVLPTYTFDTVRISEYIISWHEAGGYMVMQVHNYRRYAGKSSWRYAPSVLVRARGGGFTGGGGYIYSYHTSFASAPSRELLMMLILLDKKLV